ncbi:S-layer homology domain-containing protein [Paenibacillus sp. LHD-117]|uniref:S-layer homology domain-containing protein n=1 Tax=Paenibacillus sp. LHD-117 TaxID=3071412 RepID=UPI0027E05FDC|nr:S-layer homology domain-containing protein [Paenibacillus sp. LHD-117]MDQ6419589.1 S-layer homology domain-containing protein [Paenibacillus sp. LHD-117]
MSKLLNKGISIMLVFAMVMGGMFGLIVPGGGKAYASVDLVWGNVGNAGFSTGAARFTSLFVDHRDDKDIPYVAYTDGNGKKATVKKYDGTDWVLVGSGAVSTGIAEYTSMFVDNTGIPYVAYIDKANGSKATVMKYDGTNWVPVGGSAVSTGGANYTSLSVDHAGTPYVAYMDAANGNKATVMRYNGAAWVLVGGSAVSTGSGEFTSLYVDTTETPYVAYLDGANGYKATVMKLDNGSWVTVGDPAFSTGIAYNPSLYVDNTGTPYLAYLDGLDKSNGTEATVMKYDGDGWVPVGSGAVSSGSASFPSMFVDDNGIPYVAYTDDTNGYKATVKKFDGTDWQLVANSAASPNSGAYTSLYVNDGIPYVAYSDGSKGTKLTVRSLLMNPSALSADTIYNDDAHEIEITFEDNAAYSNNIRAVMDGTTIIPEENYVVANGKITIDAGVLSVGYHDITVLANGYAEAIVEQFIKVAYSGEGTGTQDDPYEIATATQLNEVRDHLTEAEVGAYFILTADIDLSSYTAGEGWVPIGQNNRQFTGNIDGNGFKIRNLTIDRASGREQGLFGYTGNASVIINMQLENVNVSGNRNVGALVGMNNGAISNSYAKGTVNGAYFDERSSYAVGGLVGENNATISDSYASVNVSGDQSSNLGGLVGENNATISDSYATGSVTGTGNNYGGLVGLNYGDIDSSYALGTVNGTGTNMGGLVGLNDEGTISDDSYYRIVTSVSVSPETANVAQGATKQLTATVTEVGGAAQTVTWTSSNPKVTVSASGLVTVAADTAIGSYMITATSTFDTTKSGTATITVTAATVTPAPTPTPSPSGDSTTPVTSTNGSITVPVGSTGEVSLGDKITVTIPAGASNQELKITIEELTSTQNLLTEEEVLASPVYEILKNFSENFIKPITLTFTFDSSKLSGDQTVAVFYFDEVKKEWVEVPGGTVNEDKITITVNHLTKYAVFAVGKGTTVPTPDTKPTINLSDIAGHWAEANIKQAVSSGIVGGYPNGTFKPQKKVTRAEFAVMLMNALKLQGEGAALTFTDTASIGVWAQKSVAEAVRGGIIQGYKDGTFRPNAEITRAEMTAMIASALKLSIQENAATGFADDKSIPLWAKGAVAELKNLDIVGGKGENTFDPSGNATRAEAVTVLVKMLAQMNK